VLFGLGLKNVLSNLEVRGISRGFDFLSVQAGFQIIQSLIPFDESSTYLRAFFVGLLNTLLVSILGVFFATFIGMMVGVARYLPHPILQLVAKVWIGTLRNIPLLLQIFFVYFAVLQSLPEPRNSINLFDVFFINNRGIYFPTFFGGSWQVPILEGFDFVGGGFVIPELIALAVGLSFYTSAYIGELVFASLKSVSHGLWEASSSLGLTTAQALRFVVIPEAFKVLVPPLTSQYLNIVKNSSLAAAIGYPDLVAVFSGTVLNQTGQAIEVIAMTMMVYLSISLIISLFMNYFNSKLQVAYQS
jgi:general L-amino acid transport system permease protein